MKLDLQGAFEVTATPEAAYAFLTDARAFAPLVPMFKELREIADEQFIVVLEVGVPQVRGRVDTQVRITARDPGRHAAFATTSRHPLGVADNALAFTLEPTDRGATVHWTCVSTVHGTLASLASGLLTPLATRNIHAMIASIQSALSRSEP